jgi:poly-gamma-glutamate synthesis protein (capsule biosynthesis protein)
VIFALIFAIVIFAAISHFSAKSPGNFNPQVSAPTNQTVQPKITAANAKFLFMGDIFFGRYINDWSENSPLGVKYPFQNLENGFSRKDYDAWIANFECPSVAGVNLTSAQMEATLTFNCDPKYLPEVAKYWNAVSLGNNHTDNQGREGFAETQENLAKNNIQYFGSDDPADTANDCNVIVLNVRAKMSNDQEKTLPLPFGFCGYNGVFKIPTNTDIAEITKYSDVLPTFALPHMGAEYEPAADQLRENVYREMIDAGAEMVIGNHPHWTQNTEVYKNKLIVYSMGNFIFDQQFNLEVTRSALIDVEISVKNFDAVEKWSALANDCRGNFAKCRELAKSQNLPKLELTYKFDALGSRDNDKLVRPATDAELNDIKTRLNWDATLKDLGQ